MLTPSKYWRVPCSLDSEIPQPSSQFILPDALSGQSSPPKVGHGITIAAYDDEQTTGLLRWLGIVTDRSGTTLTVEWRQTTAEIWVDTVKGRGFWKAGAFGFATTKIADYGLHALWQENFDDMVLRDHAPAATRLVGPRKTRSSISPERLNPIEVIGAPTSGVKCGVVYVLKSAFGYKVGRTRNVPDRMRAFGVKLPIIYTIPLCAWFDDCHEAEKRYHEKFRVKHINGEWFDLTERDIEQIRLRI